ncbi:preprotein translocase subunit SecE [Oribacterium sp. P9]|jgi:preprotein translocase subunit SecE|uniref:preprotein translocase subunit SecE n=1 Tax=unclassified Oribacterium TaxID=2629782 RepID=UPI0026FADB86|nr:preprotein translocase subunit SecE [Oribacterium sp.]MDD6518990.1 preprotein translocase subunit SecE [Oribacterium sp.]MDO5833533.1 preprotein translocase subunit SecE [Lachnospiraceae bacterium]MDY2853892.1 preprotein translocase subunit SecE [Oliverpabstia sp.]MEE1377616.1 preprotein translocase subunit SecE [Oribacterium sp.]
MSEKKNSGLQDFFKGLKTEYNKIIFPTRQDIIKETTATIVVSLLVGALIAVLDLIMKTGLGFIIR